MYEKGKAIDGQATFRMRHFMGNNGKKVLIKVEALSAQLLPRAGKC
jgi:hypothetical protein